MLQSIAPYATEHCSLCYRALLLMLQSIAPYITEHCSLRYGAMLCTTSNIKTTSLPHSF